MALQPGDRVSVSISPTIALAPYLNLKSHSTVSRDMPEGVNPSQFVDELTADVRDVCYQALATELGVMNELTQAIADGLDLETVLKEKIRHVPSQQTVETSVSGRASAGPRRKAKG